VLDKPLRQGAALPEVPGRWKSARDLVMLRVRFDLLPATWRQHLLVGDRVGEHSRRGLPATALF
jgi:hypothetical protein